MRNLMLFMLAAVAVGCQTVGGPLGAMKPDYSKLPADAMRAAARDVEAAVLRGERDAAIANRDGVTVDTPEVIQAIRTRAARAALVAELLDAGHAWERRDGHLWILRTDAYKKATTRKQRDRNALVVNGEKDDRWVIYEGIRKASHLPPRSLGAIQGIFHEARVELMPPGQQYEDPSGHVAVKAP